MSTRIYVVYGEYGAYSGYSMDIDGVFSQLALAMGCCPAPGDEAGNEWHPAKWGDWIEVPDMKWTKHHWYMEPIPTEYNSAKYTILEREIDVPFDERTDE